ncbi:aminoglycoside phosphotransferase family protein [Candidatus Roizmanbacteria bacterium]|nr:aminoglycoside phosphotransferase family protein [Candidatus Roizmanbacteria bacterium]
MRTEYFTDLITRKPEFSGYSLRRSDKFSQNELFYLTSEGEPKSKSYYLKIFPNKLDQFPEDSPIKKAERELTAAQLIRDELGLYVPASTYLGQDESGDTAILQEEIPGIDLDQLVRQPGTVSVDNLMHIVKQAGISLARIHGLKSASYGDLLLNYPERYSSWLECFTVDVRKRLSRGMRLGILNQKHADYFEERLGSSALNDNDSVPTLCHNDFGFKNIIIDMGTTEIVGLIDFEDARYWIPEWDLTRVNAALEYPSSNLDLRDEFLDGYVSHHGGDTSHLMKQIEYYKPFESLNYWIWGWMLPLHKENIVKDIVRVTKVH